MIRFNSLRCFIAVTSIAILSACVGGPVTPSDYQRQAGQGQYQRPAYLNAQPIPRVPPIDACRSQLYQGLIGQHEGAIYIPGLPGRKRILKPAFIEIDDTDFLQDLNPQPPLLEVRDYIPDQTLYAPSIRTVTDRIQLGPEDQNRLTIELDVDGYVQQINCY